jgi:hypothetical protein
MGPEDFATACRIERDAMLALYNGPPGESAVAAHLAAANLSSAQREHVQAALRDALTDTLYHLLLALDGCASLGGKQQSYTLHDEGGQVVANGDGALEAAAWAALRGGGTPKR